MACVGVTGGFHFSWDGEAWEDSDGEDFWSVLTAGQLLSCPARLNERLVTGAEKFQEELSGSA